jgi:pyridoxamine 5'-phosphate oxidase
LPDLPALKALYSELGISQDSVERDPFRQFDLWYQQAVDSGIAEPNGFSLCTAGRDGKPSQRTVLMKSHDSTGFVFYTNHGSRKALQLAGNNAVSMLFPWYELHRQINIEGTVTRISDQRSLEYFHSRTRDSQIGAWASKQSHELRSREVLEERVIAIEKKFSSRKLPLPEFWGGYCIKPLRFEFWQGRTHRLHDRILYTLVGNNWEITRLSP